MHRILKIVIPDNRCSGFRSMTQLCSAGRNIFRNCARSDFFPFIGDRYYVAKPLCITRALADLDFQNRKHLRFTRFVDAALMDDFLYGGYSFAAEIARMAGKTLIREDDTVFYLTDDHRLNSGIYCITDVDNPFQTGTEKIRSIYGAGAEIVWEELPEVFSDRINGPDYKLFELLTPFSLMDLSESEIALILDGSSYDLAINDNQVCLKTGSCILAGAADQFGISMKLGVIKHGE